MFHVFLSNSYYNFINFLPYYITISWVLGHYFSSYPLAEMFANKRYDFLRDCKKINKRFLPTLLSTILNWYLEITYLEYNMSTIRL